MMCFHENFHFEVEKLQFVGFVYKDSTSQRGEKNAFCGPFCELLVVGESRFSKTLGFCKNMFTLLNE